MNPTFIPFIEREILYFAPQQKYNVVMTELEKALSGEQFNRRYAEVIAFQNRVKDMCFEFNHTLPSSACDVVFMCKTMISGNKREF